MIVTRIIKQNYEVKFYPDAYMGFTTWGEFKQKREKIGMSILKFSKCFCCGHKFEDDEKVVVVSVKTRGNRFACQDCLKKEQEGEK